MIGKLFLAGGALACSATAIAQVVPAPAQAPATSAVPGPVPAAALPTLTLADHTPVQLMVLREISGNTAKPGDKFKLRVNEAVVVGGRTIVPVGAMATGEVLLAARNGHVSASGSITARLVSVDGPGGTIPLTGTQANEGDSNTGGLALGIASFGLLGLLSRGNDGRLKAGTVLTGYVDGTFTINPDSGILTRVPNAPAAPLVIR